MDKDAKQKELEAEFLGRPMSVLERMALALFSNSRDWPDRIRKPYLLAWPIAFLLRCLAVVIVIVAWLIEGAIHMAVYCYKCRWYGVRNVWSES